MNTAYALLRKELSLLIWVAIIFLLGMTILQLQRPVIEVLIWIKTAVYIGSIFVFALLSWLLNRRGDPYLFPLIAALCSLGLVFIYRLMPSLFFTQLQWIILGMCIFCLAILFFKKLEKLLHYKYLIGLIGIIFLFAAILFGTEIGGSKSWILLGTMRFQPSEFAKIFIIIFLSAYLVEHRKVLTATHLRIGPLAFPAFRFIAPLIAIWSLAVLLFLLQRDLGSALLFFGIAVSMTYMANGNLSYVTLVGVFFAISSLISYFLFAHVRVRVAIWQNPWLDPNGQAYQIVQSLLAIGSGGMLGSGLGLGYPDFIPEVHTDFIFAAAAEELGLAGAVGIILIYMLLIYRGYRIALQAASEMEMLAAAGVTTCFAWQVFIIIAGVTKLIPLTGITLPFISYGGSSLTAHFIMLALLFALSEKRSRHGA